MQIQFRLDGKFTAAQIAHQLAAYMVASEAGFVREIWLIMQICRT